MASGKGGLGSSLASFFVQIGADSTEFQKEMRAVQNALRKSVGSDALALSKDLALGFVGVAGAITAVGAACVKLSADLEQTKVAFTKMLGSSSEANKFIEQLDAFAQRTPFQFDDVTQASKKMLAMGFSAKEVIPYLGAIGDTAAGLGIGAEGINRITLALGQMQLKGKVTSEEMNKQLVEAGVKAWDYLASALGKTKEETVKMVENREVSGAFGVKAIILGMMKDFGGMSDKQNQTILGQLSNLQDSVISTARRIGEAIIKATGIDIMIRGVVEGVAKFASAVKVLGIEGAISHFINSISVITLFGVKISTGAASLGLFAGMLAGPITLGFVSLAAAARMAIVPLLPYSAWGIAAAGALMLMSKAGVSLSGSLIGLSTAIVASRVAIAAWGVTTVGSLLAVNAAAGVIGIAAMAVWELYQNWDAVAAGVSRASSWIKESFADLVDYITRAALSIKITLLGVTSDILDAGKNVGKTLAKMTDMLPMGMQGGAKKIVEAVTPNFSAAIDSIQGFKDDAKKELSQLEFEKWIRDGAKNAANALGFIAQIPQKLGDSTPESKIAAENARMKKLSDDAISDRENAQKAIEKIIHGGDVNGGPGTGKAGSKNGSAGEQLKKLATDAKQVHESIRREWLRTTQTEQQQLEAWFQEEKQKLDESRSQNANYQEDLAKLRDIYAAKERDQAEKRYKEDEENRRKSFQQEADLIRLRRDLQSTLDENRKIGMVQPQGSSKVWNDIENQAQQSINKIRDDISELQADFFTGGFQKQNAIIGMLNENRIAFEINENGKLDLAKYRAQREIEIERWKNAEIVKAFQEGKTIQADLDAAFNAGDIARYSELLKSRSAALQQELKGNQEFMNVMNSLQAESHRSMTSYMAEGYKTLYSGLTDTITGVIMGSKNAGQAIADLGKSLVEMVVKFTIQRKLAATLGAGMEKAAAAGSIGTAAAVSAAWSSAAAAVSLATFGANAGPAAAGMTTVFSLGKAMGFLPFANGGIVSKPTLGLIGERGQKEAVIPLTSSNLAAIGGGGRSNVTVNVINNSGTPVQARQSTFFDGQQQIVNVFLDAYSRNVGGLRTALRG